MYNIAHKRASDPESLEEARRVYYVPIHPSLPRDNTPPVSGFIEWLAVMRKNARENHHLCAEA